ncbi:TPA: ABC transporter ATP-binding protein [Vibrio harveyi]|uniref:ABC transporter ATP-binding protein n=1 Tax=Vibrio harveyi group TaxID=717610 RepID=UPI002119D540|nr:ABC transporter ATP-binding protein [Vibrio harveyi]EKO3829914.1 ABC transporter ATP-binding protein [Vibrio harveyi]MCQ9083623.1 ABC transporter ATP-binding protein [Vibrio harveyi]HDM8141405.1 ABC transporter ATP-binding protein [Vibrio harveyi]HDM8158161.1 ABC transporter ATP-binding protein [Vibrio harveyi]HDM8179660.1 ABC transporter ATP-binding protein [Vibrio harveyi]
MMLEVKNLAVTLEKPTHRELVSDVSFTLKEDQCLGILGESGSGKSLTCNAINGLLGEHFAISGAAIFEGEDLFSMPQKQRRQMRGEKISMIMQSPMTAFNPLFTIGNQAVETIKQHSAMSSKDATELFCDVLTRVNLKSVQSLLKKYPHELSGGMLQRIMVALALVLKPKLIIADEPTTAIDYISQREVIKELQFVREQFGTSLIFVSHDLSLVSHIADNVMVMNQGKVVEYGDTKQVFTNPQSEHTRYLVDTRMALINRFKSVMESA